MKKTGRCRKNFSVISAAIGLLFVTVTDAPVVFAAGIKVIPDASVLVQIVNFLVLIGVLNMVLYKPIRKILAQRKEKIEGLEKSIDSLHDGAGEKDKTYLDGIKSARKNGLVKKEELIQAASEEEKKVIEEINQKSQADLTAIREKILQDTDAVRVSLEKEVDSFAEAIGQKILGRAI